MTTSSCLVVTVVYQAGPGASGGGSLTLRMKAEPAFCCAHAVQPNTPAGPASGLVVPWLEGARPTTSSTTPSSPRRTVT